MKKVRSQRQITFWAGVILVLNFFDWLLTYIALSLGGEEFNPLLAGWINSWQGLAVKTIGVGLILTILVVWHWASRPVQKFFPVVAGVYALVVLWTIGNLLTIYVVDL